MADSKCSEQKEEHLESKSESIQSEERIQTWKEHFKEPAWKLS